MSNIKTLNELYDYYLKMSYAYRKSYKLLSKINKGIMISIGLGSSAVLIALIPTVPIVIAAFGALPTALSIISINLKLPNKVERMKLQYQNCKELLIFIQMNIYSDNQQDIINEVWSKSLEMQKNPFYCTPLERHLRFFNLNEYEKKTNDNLSDTDSTGVPHDSIVLRHFGRYSFKK